MIKKIITHKRPHADELMALMLLKKFPEGESLLPGVSNAPVEFLSTGELPDGKTAHDFPDVVFLGCGGGMFDEHATSQKDRDEGDCCATLVAKYLGLNKTPALQKILTFIKSEDLNGSKVKNEIPLVIKFLHSCHKDDYESISKWTVDAYHYMYLDELAKWDSLEDNPDRDRLWKDMKGTWQRPTLENTTELLRKYNYANLDWWVSFVNKAFGYQNSMFQKAGEEFRLNAKTESIKTKDNQELRLVLVTSDNEEMSKYIRSQGNHILVQFNTRGNCSITTDRKKQVDLTLSFVLLRMAEQYYRDGEIRIKDQDILSKEGFVEGMPYWYLFHNKDMGFNGSLTTSDVEPTKIPKEKVFGLVKEGIMKGI
jgi:hypothetical protein